MYSSLRSFFESYENAINGTDIHSIASFYAEEFIFAKPQGTQAVKNDDFIKALPKRSEFLKTVGLACSMLNAYEEVTLDDTYELAKIVWKQRYEKEEKPLVIDEVATTYVVMRHANTYSIVLQIDHQDLFKRVKELKLL
jgi:hypothetical protein